jgi:hypothetical protein
MRVEALLVGAHDAASYNQFLPPYANFARLPEKGSGPHGPYLGSTVLNPPFTGAGLLPAGIHLHWQLPKALRRGAADSDGVLTLPAVPDRWLVTRVLVSAAGQLTTRNWVVESSYVSLTDAYSSTSVPYAPTSSQPQPYRYLGRVYDYDDWASTGNEGPEYYAPLTTMGFGIPDFSTYYPNCINVFGLYDAELSAPGSFDPATDTLSYFVTGWYQDAQADPLAAGILSGAANALGWLFDGADPTTTLLHGSCRALGWNPAADYAYFTGLAPLTPQLALGNTPSEAVSALTTDPAEDPATAAHIERMLNVFQDGGLHRLDQAGGLADAEEELFRNEFTSFPGGTVWEVRVAAGEQAIDLTTDAAQLLTQLNQQQQQRDSLAAEVATLRARIFADWNKYLLMEYPGGPDTGAANQTLPDINDVHAYIMAEIGLLNQLILNQLTAAEAQVQTLTNELAGQLPPALELAGTPAPRYYQPNDPVLLLAGDGIPAPPPDNAATAQCVLGSALVTAIDLPAGLVTGSAAATIPASLLPPLVPTPAALPNPAILAAVQASLLLVPETSPSLVALLAQQGGSTNPAVLDATGTAQALQAAQTAAVTVAPPPNDITFTGSVLQPDIAYQSWSQPWYPLAISWNFHYFPLVALSHSEPAGYPANLVVEQLSFDPGTFDYEYPAGTEFSTVLQQVQGTVLLGSGAAANLNTALRQAQHYNPDGPAPDPDTVPMLAQALSGFHAALLMLAPTMQLPVADPLATTQSLYTFSNTTVRDAVAEHNQQSPLFNYLYNPLRAGLATLAEVWLIDSFGRYQAVSLAGLAVTETIPTTLMPGGPLQLQLPLRLAQPAQLDFRWLLPDASAPLSSAPGQSPVCGWVVPNHLDGSLMFYDADGTGLGALLVASSGDALSWASAPGSPAAYTDINAAFAPPTNPVLAQFALAALAGGSTYVGGLLRTFDATQPFVLPASYQQDVATVVLTGAPLALVQASLELALLGLPVPDQSYDALTTDTGNLRDPLTRSTYGFTEVEIPVLLGSLAELNDGLYGYFRPTTAGAAGTYDFATCYAPAADGSAPGVVAPTTATLTLTAGATAPTPLALLLDPRGEVHAACGVLPVKAIEVPPALYTQALSQLRYNFLTAPVLWPNDQVTLPLPTEADSLWSWVGRRPDGSWTPATAVLPPDQQALLQNATAVAEGWLQLSRNPNQ